MPTSSTPAPKAAKKTTAKPTKKKAAQLTAADVVAAVRRHYGAERDGLGPEWAGLDEYTLAPGAGLSRADLFLVRCWRSRPKGHERHAIEVKVSRSDLRNELANPHKAAVFEDVSHRFYLAVPKGLLRPDDELPDHWGVYEVSERGACRKVREARRRDDIDPLGEAAVVEAFRRAARAEARIRGAEAAGDAAAQVVGLTRSLASAERSRHAAQQSAQKYRRNLTTLLGSIATAGGWLCVCGAPVQKSKGGFAQAHDDGTPCTEARYGYPTIDFGSLAARLGLDPAAEGWPGEPTPAEVLEHARRLLAAAPEGSAAAEDPAELLARLRTLLTSPTTTDPTDPAAGPGHLGDDAPEFFGPAGP